MTGTTAVDVPSIMSKAEAAVREIVEAFVEQLSVLIRRAALESVQDALGSGALRRGAHVPSVAATTRRRKGAKRTAEELEALVKTLHSFVAKHPGQRIEQIGKALGVPTKELVLPVKKSLSEKRILTKGAKGATTYYSK